MWDKVGVAYSDELFWHFLEGLTKTMKVSVRIPGHQLEFEAELCHCANSL
jgi:hypothetical protein